ncbi:FtsH protease activity modulator HflK [Roseospira goensis]|uniref:Protein HflK n=1 Tax=Roseospira goensis TaxID=391922 RepID=A0A7W6S3X2_9PROT|nr:FtsH protease activity modulator HflK [Roseospira goensis]MBB4287712.1 membrane protease subunit HflK [Roseospira goensis]
MAWNPQGGGGGGPWGGGGNGGNGPWGRGGGGAGGGPRTPPPDLEEMLRRGQERLRTMLPNNLGPKAIGLLVVALLVLWGLTGFYRVQVDEQGVVLRFGEYVYKTGPGLHYHLPYPIETVMTPKVTRENRVVIGFRQIGDNLEARRDVTEESLMLTGDENIIDIDFALVWVIKDAADYLFNLRDPAEAVQLGAESAMREVIGQTPIQVALTEGRQEVEDRTRVELQRLLDEYEAGIAVRRVQLLKVDPPSEVVDAFNDVQRARADRERLSNEAEAYRNSIIPQARGEAERLLQESEAYREEIVNRAQGDASRFDSVYQAYSQAKDVTTQRIYLETMEEVLANVNKVIIGTEGGSGVVPYLPLPELQNRMREQQQRDGTSATGGGSRSGAAASSFMVPEDDAATTSGGPAR